METPASGPSADTRKLTALTSRFATETLRLRFGFKVCAIGFQFCFGWTNDAPTFADRKRNVSSFGSRQRGETRKPHEISRKNNIIRRRFAVRLRRRFPSIFGAYSLLAMIARVCPRLYLNGLVRQTFTAPNHAVFCLFVRLSCPGALPKTEGPDASVLH